MCYPYTLQPLVPRLHSTWTKVYEYIDFFAGWLCETEENFDGEF